MQALAPRILLMNLAMWCAISNAVVCTITTFPTNNNLVTTSGEVHTYTTPLAGLLTPSSLTCTTNGITANTKAYGQINLGFDLTSSSAGNVCSRTQGALPQYVQNHGTFIYNAESKFVNAAGSEINSGYGDSTSTSTVYYTAIQSLWIGSESCTTPDNPVALT